MAITIDDVLKAHDKDGYLIAVSNGFVKYMHHMCFGQVLSTSKGLHLAKSFGGYDGRGSSLRAKTVRMLFITIFIALMAKHRNCTNIKIQYASDNLELINRSTEHLDNNNPCPNTMLSAEKEITEKIYMTNKTYKIDALFQYVYGCQDTKSRGEMAMKASLNVVADKLAGDF